MTTPAPSAEEPREEAMTDAVNAFRDGYRAAYERGVTEGAYHSFGGDAQLRAALLAALPFLRAAQAQEVARINGQLNRAARRELGLLRDFNRQKHELTALRQQLAETREAIGRLHKAWDDKGVDGIDAAICNAVDALSALGGTT